MLIVRYTLDRAEGFPDRPKSDEKWNSTILKLIEPGVFHLGIVPACPAALTGSPARAHSGPGMAEACPSV
jgi:hypothetical protein